MVNDVEVPLHGNTPQAEGTESPGRNLSAHRIDGNEGDPQPGHHTLLDRFGVIELHGHAELDTRLLQRPLGDTPRRRAFLSYQQRLIGERRGGDGSASSPSVPRRDDEHELVTHSGRETLLARPERMPPDDAKIELTFPDSHLNGL